MVTMVRVSVKLGMLAGVFGSINNQNSNKHMTVVTSWLCMCTCNSDADWV